MTYLQLCMLIIHSQIINSNFNCTALQHFSVSKLLLPPLNLWTGENRDFKHSQFRVVGRVFEVNLPIQSRAPVNLISLLCFWGLVKLVYLSSSWYCYTIFLGFVGWFGRFFCFSSERLISPVLTPAVSLRSMHLPSIPFFYLKSKATFSGLTIQGILNILSNSEQ